jgi:hypothetical protein
MKVFENPISKSLFICGHLRAIRGHLRSSLSTQMSANIRKLTRILTGDVVTTPMPTFPLSPFTFSRGLRPLLP